MEKENLPEEAKPKQEGSKEQEISADDLKFMRSVVEKMHRQINPEAHVMIMWGFICMIIYIGIHFLIEYSLHKWIYYLYVPPIVIGAFYSVVNTVYALRREKKAGCVSRVSIQLVWAGIIVMSHAFVWDMLGVFDNTFCGAGFIYALSLSIFLSMGGIFYSKEWLFGGIGIFAGMLLAFFVKDYSLVILGLAIGAGCIITAIIAQKNYRKWKKENAQG